MRIISRLIIYIDQLNAAHFKQYLEIYWEKGEQGFNNLVSLQRSYVMSTLNTFNNCVAFDIHPDKGTC